MNFNNNVMEKIINFIISKKGEKVTVIDLRGFVYFCDYFVIANTQNTIHNRSLAKLLVEELNKNKIKIHHIEGEKQSEWILIDCYDIIIHLFLPAVREYYAIEDLFADLPRWDY
ncbi:MAG: ribosome silencing factor [Candidatus Hydrogenedentota bacterium]